MHFGLLCARAFCRLRKHALASACLTSSRSRISYNWYSIHQSVSFWSFTNDECYFLWLQLKLQKMRSYLFLPKLPSISSNPSTWAVKHLCEGNSMTPPVWYLACVCYKVTKHTLKKFEYTTYTRVPFLWRVDRTTNWKLKVMQILNKLTVKGCLCLRERSNWTEFLPTQLKTAAW